MDAVSLTIGVRGLGMLFLILGGLAALYFGYRVMSSGSASQPTATFKLLGVNATAKGSGAVIMITAGLWAYCGVRIAPNLATNGSESKVYSFQTNEGKVTAPTLAASALPATDREGLVSRFDNAYLQRLFANSVMANEAFSGERSSATLDGEPASIDARSASVVSENGKLLLATFIRSADKSAEVTFIPKLRGDVMMFVPNAVAGDSDRAVPKQH
jgi:hypothetical protein